MEHVLLVEQAIGLKAFIESESQAKTKSYIAMIMEGMNSAVK